MNKILLEYASERDLYLSYMPFIKNGGLFVRTSDLHALGSEIVLEVILPDALEASIIEGVVCWSTPLGSHNSTPAGIGISFEKDPDNIRHQIEKIISRLLSSSDPTLTM